MPRKPPPQGPLPPPAEKSKEERGRETITILGKLKEVGIADTDPGFVAVKDAMRAWVSTGEACTHTIEFPRAGRRGTLVLPSRADRTVGLTLKVVS